MLIISRKDIPAWKSKGSNQDVKLLYSNSGERINDIFKPLTSDVYAFILSNKNRFKSVLQPSQLTLCR
jgi:hypothetical protein